MTHAFLLFYLREMQKFILEPNDCFPIVPRARANKNVLTLKVFPSSGVTQTHTHSSACTCAGSYFNSWQQVYQKHIKKTEEAANTAWFRWKLKSSKQPQCWAWQLTQYFTHIHCYNTAPINRYTEVRRDHSRSQSPSHTCAECISRLSVFISVNHKEPQYPMSYVTAVRLLWPPPNTPHFVQAA